MGEPPCAKSREKVVYFSPLLVAFNTRVAVFLPPGPCDPALNWGARRQGATSSSPPPIPYTELRERNQCRGHGLHTGLSPLRPQKRVERVNEVNEEN